MTFTPEPAVMERPSRISELSGRYAARLERWVSGRLPADLGQHLDLPRLVHQAIVQVAADTRGPHPDEHQSVARLREEVLALIEARLRALSRRPEQPGHAVPPGSDVDTPPRLGAELFARYDASLDRLAEHDRNAIILKIELALSWTEVAALLGKPNVAAARLAVTRALLRLAHEMAR